MRYSISSSDEWKIGMFKKLLCNYEIYLFCAMLYTFPRSTAHFYGFLPSNGYVLNKLRLQIFIHIVKNVKRNLNSYSDNAYV